MIGRRRWRGAAIVVAVIFVAGVLVVLLPPAPDTIPLDPGNTGPEGTHALADLMTQRGQVVRPADGFGQALRLSRPAGSTLVITNPGALPQRDLTAARRSGANLLLIAPGRAALATLAPGVSVMGRVRPLPVPPECAFPAAAAAGPADVGGVVYQSTSSAAWRCYPRPPPGGFTSLISQRDGGHLVTVLGTGRPLTNAMLTQRGDAALALNLLAGTRRVVWLTIPPAPTPPGAIPAPQARGLATFIPAAFWLVAAELGVAVLLAALWRVRRFGPLVPEPLPVSVRASETVEGHGRLYRSRRARDRAAEALRAAALARIAGRLCQPAGMPPEAVCAELAQRTGRETDDLVGALYGAAPADDAALLALATELDTLEGQVLAP